MLVNYFLLYIEIARLPTTTTTAVITQFKPVFAHHGIPEELISDNGTQFSSAEFSQFSRDCSFHHITSNPKYPQVNGEAERSVKTIKCILRNNQDPYLGLLAHCSTPLQNGYSPAELLMGCKLRTTILVIPQ